MNGKSRLSYSPGCRLKKTKCDGKRPCSRCEAEDTVCSFAMPKKFRNVVHPKGSVEMLLQQQEWLVSGLLELYRRTQLGCGSSSDSPPDGKAGLPSVHHILEQLGVLEENHHCSPPDPGIVASLRQHICENSDEMYEATLYSPKNDPGDSQIVTFDNLEDGSCYHTFAPPPTDRILFPPRGDHQHSDTAFLWDYDSTMRLDEPAGELLSAEATVAFGISQPPAIYGRGTVIPTDTFHQQHSRSPSDQNMLIPASTESIQHGFGSIAIPTTNAVDQRNR
ncbi:Fungal Zn2-Cys6 binuclear cluster domain-containing protein [Cladophialophora immunda]|nr:Fungal Zn2-Cys6 binuclear cluster domain-containing protein [Cladophialophora immunda]